MQRSILMGLVVVIAIGIGFYKLYENENTLKASLNSLTTQVNNISKSLVTTSTGTVITSSVDSSIALFPIIKPAVSSSDTAAVNVGILKIFANKTLKEYSVTFAYTTKDTNSAWKTTDIDFLNANGFTNQNMIWWEASAYIPRKTNDTTTSNIKAHSHDVVVQGASSASAITYKFLSVGYPGTYTAHVRVVCKV